ncbi:MAG: hypothetical protein Q8P80_05635 [Candidatus Levybacteria bacterium]|nr:hypothetical protein [Candidatus Levybacteria bacterium]
MENERCKDGEHKWVCQEIKGDLGETVVTNPIDPSVIEQIINDPKEAQQVCPHGSIVCGCCKEPLLSKEAVQGITPQTEDFTRLKDRLIK